MAEFRLAEFVLTEFVLAEFVLAEFVLVDIKEIKVIGFDVFDTKENKVVDNQVVEIVVLDKKIVIIMVLDNNAVEIVEQLDLFNYLGTRLVIIFIKKNLNLFGYHVIVIIDLTFLIYNLRFY